MKIKVVFKLNKTNGYDEDNKFTYAGYEGVEVNDIVVVNTRYGYAIAKVVEVDVEDERFSEENLATVKEVVETAETQRAEQEKKDSYNRLVKKIKREQMETALLTLTKDAAEQDLIKGMSEQDLKTFYNAIMR